MIDIPVYQLLTESMVNKGYELLDARKESAILVEYKDLI